MPLAATAQKLGAEILRLWCAATDYSGDLAIDDKILARVIDAYRRIRNTLRFLLANTSDFDPARRGRAGRDARDRPLGDRARGTAPGRGAGALRGLRVPSGRRQAAALLRGDLGAFYLDILKDRLYTTAPGSLARRSAQTALWQVTRDAALDGTVPLVHRRGGLADVRAGRRRRSSPRPSGRSRRRTLPLLAKWARIRGSATRPTSRSRRCARRAGVGSSLQAVLRASAPGRDHALLASLGDDLRFVTITSQATLAGGDGSRSGSRRRRRRSAPAAGTTATTSATTPRTRRCAAAARATCTARARRGPSPDGGAQGRVVRRRRSGPGWRSRSP